MGKTVLLLGSVTYALRGRDLLLRHGIRAYVERLPRTNGAARGCGYGVAVPRRAEEAEQLLREFGLHVLGRAEEEAQ